MTTYQITIDENNIQGKNFLIFIKTLPFISVSKNRTKKMNELDEALEDIRIGRVSKPMTIEEFKEHLDDVWQEALNEI